MVFKKTNKQRTEQNTVAHACNLSILEGGTEKINLEANLGYTARVRLKQTNKQTGKQTKASTINSFPFFFSLSAVGSVAPGSASLSFGFEACAVEASILPEEQQ